jgi:hypothetical protein
MVQRAHRGQHTRNIAHPVHGRDAARLYGRGTAQLFVDQPPQVSFRPFGIHILSVPSGRRSGKAAKSRRAAPAAQHPVRPSSIPGPKCDTG